MNAREKLVVSWQSRASVLITRKLDDTEAHAFRALTQTLKRTEDGRATLRRAARSTSYTAAVSRLGELLDRLAGPTLTSRDGMLRDAREAFYLAALERHRPLIPLELLKDRINESQGVAAARRIVIHGYELRAELAGPIDRASRNLLATLEQAAGRSTPDDIAEDLLLAWRRRAEGSITQSVNAAISDAEVRLDVIAGRDLVKPEYLDDEPVAVGN